MMLPVVSRRVLYWLQIHPLFHIARLLGWNCRSPKAPNFSFLSCKISVKYERHSVVRIQHVEGTGHRTGGLNLWSFLKEALHSASFGTTASCTFCLSSLSSDFLLPTLLKIPVLHLWSAHPLPAKGGAVTVWQGVCSFQKWFFSDSLLSLDSVLLKGRKGRNEGRLVLVELFKGWSLYKWSAPMTTRFYYPYLYSCPFNR